MIKRIHWFGLLQAGFVFWVMLGAAWGWFFPDLATPGAGWIREALMLIMLGMGLTLRAEDIKALRHAGKPLLLGVSLQYLVMPLVAWLLSWLLNLSPVIALGVILVGCSPGGTASNVVTWLARGDVALSVAMTTASTLIAPLMTPLWVWLIASAWLDIDPVVLFASVVQIVLLPVLIGIIIRRFWQPEEWILDGVFPLIAMLTISWIVGVVVALNVEHMADIAFTLAVAVVLLNLAGLLFGHSLSRIAGQPIQQSRTVAIEVGMQNSGLAVVLAMAHFSAEAALAGAIFSIWHNVSGAVLAAVWRRQA